MGAKNSLEIASSDARETGYRAAMALGGTRRPGRLNRLYPAYPALRFCLHSKTDVLPHPTRGKCVTFVLLSTVICQIARR